MEHSTLSNSIEKLEKLGAQRTARTDRLHEAVSLWLGSLERAGVAAGDRVKVDDVEIGYYVQRSNQGSDDIWSCDIGLGESCSDLARPVGGRGAGGGEQRHDIGPRTPVATPWPSGPGVAAGARCGRDPTPPRRGMPGAGARRESLGC